jgi:hypothetical protein
LRDPESGWLQWSLESADFYVFLFGEMQVKSDYWTSHTVDIVIFETSHSSRPIRLLIDDVLSMIKELVSSECLALLILLFPFYQSPDDAGKVLVAQKGLAKHV